VPAAVVAERRTRLLELERDLATTYFRSLVGRRLEVLVEGADPQRLGHVLGTSCRYAPVTFAGHAPALLGQLVPVRAVGVADGVVLAQPEELPQNMEISWGRWALPLLSQE